jgi:thiamine-monophosphate kinase
MMFENEMAFVRWLQGQLRNSARGLRLGIGDDAALVEIPRGHDLILTTDMSLEDVHFRRGLQPARSIGHRALARSLSDIAAMGGRPRYALVSLAISKRATRAWIGNLYLGMLTLARRFGVAVVGGDTARVSGPTLLDVIVAGDVPRGRALLRSGAQPGDQVFVSGRLGYAALGLRLLMSPPRRRLPHRVEAIRAHLYPEPQCALGRFLSARRLASALMDLSDGLSTDLARLCEASGVGARLWANLLPGPSPQDAEDCLRLALHGGEDYQLLFTVPPGKVSRIPARFGDVPLHRIGEIQKAKGQRLVGTDGKVQPLRPAGWDCFR